MLQTAFIGGGGTKKDIQVCIKKRVCEITLQNVTYEVIQGKVRLITEYRMVYNGLLVELDGTIGVGPSKDYRISQTKLSNKPSNAGSNTVLTSNIWCLVGNTEASELKPGSYEFSFVLKIPEKNFPTSQSSPYGSVEYTLKVYERRTEEPLAVKAFKFPGNYNLCFFPIYLLPVVNELHIPSRGIVVSLRTPQVDYVMGEDVVAFTVDIFNPEAVAITRVSVKFLRITIYSCKSFKKTTLDTLDNVVKKNIRQKTFDFGGTFTAAHFGIVTYSSKTLNVDYWLQCEVVTSKCTTSTTGQLRLAVGTARTPRDPVSRGMQTLQLGVECPSRSTSMTSLPPPNYSELCPRRASISSFDTLPPHYSDIQEC